MKLPMTDSLVFISRRLRIIAGTTLLVLACKVFIMPEDSPAYDDAAREAGSQIAITHVSERTESEQ